MVLTPSPICYMKNLVDIWFRANSRSMLVNRLFIFFVRAVLGAVFAVAVTRMFYPQTNPIYVALLGVFLVGAAYGLEALKGGRKNKQEPPS